MSEDRTAVSDAVTAILTDLSTSDDVVNNEPAGWNSRLWSALADSGFSLVSVPEEAGGSGGDLADACAVLEALGRFAAAVPVAESSLMAGWALAAAGLDVPHEPITSITGHPHDTTTLTRTDGGWHLTGHWHRVPWASQATHLVVVGIHDGHPLVCSVPTERLTIRPGSNLAGETRDDATADGVKVDVAHAPARVTPEALRLRGALGRAAATGGALMRIAELTTRYTAEREQFGRPLSRFQAVQRHVVRVAEKAHTVAMAAECAAANAAPEPDLFDVAAAKIIAAESASVAAAAAHQAHGAIGMTMEYPLGHYSRRVWSWRDEFGNESHWSRLLGAHITDAGADELWPRISRGLEPTFPGGTP